MDIIFIIFIFTATEFVNQVISVLPSIFLKGKGHIIMVFLSQTSLAFTLLYFRLPDAC